jgi:hypothetical protein
VEDVGSSVLDRVAAPIGKFALKNIGFIGAGALAIVCPPAGAVAIAALAAQALAMIANAAGLKGPLSDVLGVLDTAGGIASGNFQKIASSAAALGGTAAGLLGSALKIKELQDAGAAASDIAKAAKGDPAAITRLAGLAAKTAGSITGLKELKAAGELASSVTGALKGNPQSIAAITRGVGKIAGSPALQTIADGVDVASNLKNGKFVPGKMATEALRLASPQAYAALQKMDPRLLTNQGIHALADMAKKANPQAAAALMMKAELNYKKDVTSSINGLINNAKSPNAAVRNAALKIVADTRKLAATGNQDAQRAAAMLSSVVNLQQTKNHLTRMIPPVRRTANGGNAIFIAKNGGTIKGSFVRNPRGQPGVLVLNGKRYAGNWSAA